ncbi:PA0069 family radical SAM protein [Geminicoccaceae bacterium 1502E]|nr:PA0069 family radical SAM protein [Geminicoccaceae bacterium 1502E]
MAMRIHKGRGAPANPAGRFELQEHEAADDGWGSLELLAEDPSPRTEVLPDASRTVIARNDSPDIGFDRSINPYRGCEHGCVYCYARPSHAYLGLSSGLDFETKLFAKHDAAALLRRELARPGYRAATMALGTNTDPYQPIERRLAITRSVLEVLLEAHHPFAITTKSASVVRDLDILTAAGRQGLCRVDISVTTLDGALARLLEPRASTPALRLEAVRRLAAAGVPVGVNVAPVIPGLTDHEIERILEAAATAGAGGAGWILLRLPFEVKELFEAWLAEHRPLRARHVLSLLRQCREGRLNDPAFGSRMRGSGPIAALIRQRFERALARHGLDRPRRWSLRTDLFRPPSPGGQLDLF